MLKYELKKVFSKISSKVALFILLVELAITCSLAISSVYFVDESGESIRGAHAVLQLKTLKNQWKGDITVEKLQAVITENQKVNASEEYLSKNIQEQNKAYGKKQGFMDIRDLINRAFSGFREYDYFRADSVSLEEVEDFYKNRVLILKEWLESDEAKDLYSKEEKEFFIAKYEELEVPLYYEYSDGWQALIENALTIIMLHALIVAFLVSGIFSSEFQLKADAIFFSTELGRNKAVKSKIYTGFLIVTGLYWGMILVYTCVVLGVLGADGGNCLIQTGFGGWKSFYNITYIQEYLLTILGGYLGNLFILTLSMLISAKTRSMVFAVTIPFIILFLPSFLSEISVLSEVLGVLPDRLLQMNMVVKYFQVYEMGGKVVSAVPILMILYFALYLVMGPALYQVYRRMEVK